MVQTFTPVHGSQQNALTSRRSIQVSASNPGPSAPTLAAPLATTETQSLVRFAWSPVGGSVDDYILELTQPDASVRVFWYMPGDACSGGSCSALLRLSQEGGYNWRMRTHTSGIDDSPWSSGSFTLSLPGQSAPPLLETLDDGAAHWQATGAWSLSDAGRMGDSGLGWQVTADSDGTSLLTWQQLIDLSGVSSPRLVFYSRLRLSASKALVQVRDSNSPWRTVALVMSSADWVETQVDLRAYRGSIIQLRFAWLGVESSDQWSIDMVGVDNAWQEVTVVPSATVLPQATETLSPKGSVTLPPGMNKPVIPVGPDIIEPLSPKASVTLPPGMNKPVIPVDPEIIEPPPGEVILTVTPPTPTLIPTETPLPTAVEPSPEAEAHSS